MQCSVFIAVTLDGFIARRDGSIDWLSLVERPGEDYGYREFFESVDSVIIGRSTYNLALGFDPWPYAGKRCVVLTHSSPTPHHGEQFDHGLPEQLLARLSAEGAKRAYVDGGTVIQQFLAAGLITDLTLSFIPVLIGEGIPLFAKIGRDVRLSLRKSTAFEGGLVQIEYGVG